MYTFNRRRIKISSIEINGAIISINNKEIVLKINSNTHVISVYVILKFLSNALKNPKSLYIILEDEKGSITYEKNNVYEIQDFTLNDFLQYYSSKSNINDWNSSIDEESSNIKTLGWRIVYEKNIQIKKSDINYINDKVNGYIIAKFKKIYE